MDQTIKHQLAKLMTETHLSWVKCLPLALLNIRTMPHGEIRVSPYEMLYGMPYSQEMPLDHSLIEDYETRKYVITLGKQLNELQEKGVLTHHVPLGFTAHKIQPGDKVLIKTWKGESLSPHWEGPYLILLITETARTVEKGWMHAS